MQFNYVKAITIKSFSKCCPEISHQSSYFTFKFDMRTCRYYWEEYGTIEVNFVDYV